MTSLIRKNGDSRSDLRIKNSFRSFSGYKWHAYNYMVEKAGQLIQALSNVNFITHKPKYWRPLLLESALVISREPWPPKQVDM